jgi:hypothetical protein
MTVHSIPDVLVREAVDVHVETTRIDVDVGNDSVCDNPSIPPPLEKYLGVEFYLGP